ncbi:MAG: translocation/assembly module TamB [Chitinophagaceae bacterium]|nr:translocation/assembly module TamB [Chitinophagaceae bacterium]
MVTKPSHNSSATALRRIGRVCLKIVIGILALFIIVVLLIQTPPVQNFARKKIVAFLENKLQTRVAIGRISIGIPNKVLLENIYVEDKQKDTLLSGGRISANIDMFKLINSEIEINQLEIENLTAKIKRILPDTLFNFQFIVDAFTPKKTSPANPADTAALKMALDKIRLDKIRLVYKDAVTGSDMDIWLEHFDTNIETFDPARQIFNVPVSNINGLRATIYQHKPLVEAQPLTHDMAEAVQPTPFNFSFKELVLKNIILDYKNDVSAFYTSLNLGDLIVEADKIDMQNKVITLDEIQLNQSTASIRLGKKQAAKEVVKQVAQEVESQAQNDWRFVVSKIRFNNNNIQFDDDNTPRLPSGMDYAHLKAQGFTLHANDFVFTMDSIAGEITRGELNEQSGFVLTTLETKFVYAARQAYLHDLLLKTPGTTIQRAVSIRYPSMEALQKDIGSMQMDIDLENSRIQTKDILVFAPQLRSQPAFRNQSAVWFLNSRITGSVSRMQIHALQFRGLQNTRADLKGTISGLPDVNKLNASLAINTLTTTKNDIQSLLPKNTLPDNITLPDRINLNGTVTGNMASMKTDLNVNTNLGNATVDGTFGNLTTPADLQYNTVLTTQSLNLGKILQNEQSFGTVTANITAVGKGIDPKTANAKIRGIVQSAVINKYNYSNLQLNASIERQQLVADLTINDPNIHLALNAKSDLSAQFPAIQITADIDSIKALPLNLTQETLVYRGKITGNFPVTDPKNLQGELLITHSIIVTKDQRFILDSVEVKAGRTDSGQFINVRSDAINATLTGQYNLVQLGDVMQQSIQPYYSLVPNYKIVPVDPYNFTLNAHVINGPLLKAFVPGLEHLEPVAIRTHFTTNEGFNASVNSPLIIFNGNRLENFTLNAGTSGGAIVLNATMQKFGSGTAMNLHSTQINASVANNKINFMVGIKDKNANNKYRLGGIVDQPEPGVYALSLRADSLMLNYDQWTLAQNNIVRFNSNNGDINVSNFVLSKGTQQLRIQSTSTALNAPLQVNFGNFRIGTITAFLKQDTVLADGMLNGQVVLSNITQQPTFTSDITVTDLTIMKDTVGNLALKVNNTTQNIFTAEGMLSGKGNEILLNGQYLVKPANQSSYDLTVDIRQLQMTSVVAASMGSLTRGSGYINGKIDINGTFEKPAVNGSLNFNKAGFSPVLLGSYFMVDQERININQAGILFDTFTIRDSVNNALVLDGYAYTSNFVNYRFDLDINAQNFQAINTTKRSNALYYGKLYFDSDLRIRGTEKLPVIDGAVTINESTDFTVVMPQQQPGLAEREGIVRFVDMDSVKMDTSFFASYDTLNKSDLTGLDVSVNIEVNRKATFSLVVDEANGDFVRMKGEAQLTGGIDKSGKVSLTGSYEIEEGSYEISLNLLKRKFNILKGSKIIWLGEPTRADIDVTAVYIANTSPLTLVKQTLGNDKNENYYKQKLPFEVHLKLTGQLLRPDINFDIRLPENKTFVAGTVTEDVEFRLAQIRQDPSELNKQVFSILLFNRFINENPFASEGGGGFNAGIMARQSVSKLLAEQLNDIAGDLIAGVEINFDIQSYEDYSTGDLSNRSDLNVSLSKQLLNDRLKVTVGNNFQLEGAQNANQGNAASGLAGNIALDYQLSRDGRYMVRAYRKNEYEGEIEGYIIESGINFIITLDYNHFRELFRKKKKQPVQQAPTLPPNGDRKETAPVSDPPEAKLNEQE